MILTTVCMVTNAFVALNSASALKTAFRSSATSLMVVYNIVSPDEFEQKVMGEKKMIVVVDFHKNQCNPCVKSEPLYRSLSDRFDNKVIFYKLDADAWSGALKFMKELGVKSVPTFQVWRAGTQIHRGQGASALPDLEKFLSEVLDIENAQQLSSFT